MSNILKMSQINKEFNGVPVLKNVDFSLDIGKIYALIGENGAGKSTLMNILGGVIHADSGSIFIDGDEVKILTPSDAKDQGIAFIHQELNLVNDLTIYENLFLGAEILNKFGFLDVEKMCRETKKVLDQLQVDIDPKTLVSKLDASYKQVVEIAKAIYANARILIMDEPTSSLTNVEIDNVFNNMRNLKNHGVSIIFISHKLKELIAICDHYTVLRDGEVVANGIIEDDNISEEDIARLMIKNDIQTKKRNHKESCCGDVIFEAEDYSLGKYFNNINFSLRQGEILGFTGLLGDGRSELFQSIFGAIKGATGTLKHHGKEITIKDTTSAIKSGIGYMPKNRKENAIIKDFTVTENITLVALKKFKNFLLLSSKKESECTKKCVDLLQVKIGNKKNLITSLSGGNQQKIVLGKWLEANPNILILDNPTQGVDVGGKYEIYSIIYDLAKQGISIIVLSNEAQEILQLCDRTFVMYHGNIAGMLSSEEATEEKIMILATGGRVERVNKNNFAACGSE